MPNPAELKKIWAGAREAGLTDEQLRDLVDQVSGQRSTRALGREQTARLIDALVCLGARPGQPRAKPSGKLRQDGVLAMVSPEQRAFIDNLRQQLGGDWLEDRYFKGACLKRIKKDRPATSGDAGRVIEMLKQRVAYNTARAQRDAG